MVHAFGREDFEVMQFHQQAQQSLQANLRLTLTNVNSALVISTLMVIGTAAMYYVGTLHVLAGTLSLGSLLVFSAYLLMLYQPLESLTYTAWAMEGATAAPNAASKYWIVRTTCATRQCGRHFIG
jgi:ABC-type multidrug transport system fused ATPase/permease subunit